MRVRSPVKSRSNVLVKNLSFILLYLALYQDSLILLNQQISDKSEDPATSNNWNSEGVFKLLIPAQKGDISPLLLLFQPHLFILPVPVQLLIPYPVAETRTESYVFSPSRTALKLMIKLVHLTLQMLIKPKNCGRKALELFVNSRQQLDVSYVPFTYGKFFTTKKARLFFFFF